MHDRVCCGGGCRGRNSIRVLGSFEGMRGRDVEGRTFQVSKWLVSLMDRMMLHDPEWTNPTGQKRVRKDECGKIRRTCSTSKRR
eukprot:10316133-Alexandrium_andersonii.AAC.1